jgi:HK97 family phage major capsid protein
MTMNVNHRALRGSTAIARGMKALRADADPLAEVKTLLAEIGQKQKAHLQTFEEFKKENDAKIEAKTKDVVQADKVERINTALETQGKAIDDINSAIAAIKIGGGGDKKGMNAAERAHAKAFDAWFRKGKDPEALRELELKASLSVGSDPDGGYTVTPVMEQTIDRILPAVSAVRSLATVMQIGTGAYKKLFNKAGAASGWVGETETRANTAAPQLAAQDFPVMEIYAQPAATQTLLDDSFVNIENWLADECAIVFAEQEGIAFVSGDGNNKPKGITAYATVADATFAGATGANWGKLGYIATGAATDFAAASQADCLFDLEDSLKTGYQPNARWLMNRKTRSSIRKFKNSLGDYLWQPGLQIGVPDTLDGKPITIDDNMPNIGAGTYPIAFGDFKRGYLIVDRVGIRILRDPFTAKPYVLFYTTKRVGGGVQNFEAVKLLKVAAS